VCAGGPCAPGAAVGNVMTMSQTTIDELFSAGEAAEEVAPAPPDASPTHQESSDDACASAAQERTPEVTRILSLEVPVSVTLAERPMSVASIIDIKVGTILEFDVPADAELSLFVANQVIGVGQAVKIGENFGLRVDIVSDVEQRIDALGGS
jgi:flagellar motor switch protein FliN/FliY